MPRALVAVWNTVPGAARADALARWRERRDRLSAAGCHYWIFESTSQPGRFLEFTEARDAETLAAARASAGARDDDYLTEVELD
jgi:hypothetical protein